MNSYLFHRRDLLDADLSEAPVLAAQVFFQMWRVRADPFNQFAEGALLYVASAESRTVLWEVRATDMLARQYGSIREALAALRAAYGLYASDLNEYHQSRQGHGWLLAWAPVVMRRLHVEMPAGLAFGRNGYRELSPELIRGLGLPTPKARRPLATPPPWYDPEAGRLTRRLEPVPRYIPVHVRRQVFERDGGRCVGCGTAEGLHFDHIQPWSHGGRSTPENLRLLCARSNLSKGAGLANVTLICRAAATADAGR